MDIDFDRTRAATPRMRSDHASRTMALSTAYWGIQVKQESVSE